MNEEIHHFPTLFLLWVFYTLRWWGADHPRANLRDYTKRVGAYTVPFTNRMGLFYGYFDCARNQVAETIDHINLLHTRQSEGEAKAILDIIEAEVPTILDVSLQVFVNGMVGPDASSKLHLLFRKLQDVGATQYIHAICPIDEPNLTTTAEELTKAVSLIREVAGSYRGLGRVKLAAIYACDAPFLCPVLFDYLGCDCFGKRASLLSEQYLGLRALLQPWQKTILVPGGSYGQDPTPFINFAQENPEVAIVLPYVWFDAPGGSVGAPGIRSQPGQTDMYRAAGKLLTQTH